MTRIWCIIKSKSKVGQVTPPLLLHAGNHYNQQTQKYENLCMYFQVSQNRLVIHTYNFTLIE